MKKFFVPILLQYNLSLINSSFIFSYIHLTTFPYSKQSSNIQFIREWRKIWHDGNRPLYRVCRRCPHLHMELNLSNIASGSYKISEHYVNRSQESVYDQWIAMSTLEPNSTEELELSKKTSPPGFHQHLVTVGSDEILRLNVTLDLLEIRLIEILLITDTIYL